MTVFLCFVCRFSGAENHAFIFEFFTYMGEHYLGERRPKDFVFHLLSMNIPGLFGIEPSKNNHAAQSVPVCFKTMLRDYIQRNRLTNSVVGHVTAIWVSTYVCVCVCITNMLFVC